jgi:ATP-binding cassette subfamily B protein
VHEEFRVKDLQRLVRLIRTHTAMYAAAIVALIAGSAAFLFIPPQFGRLMAALNSVAAGQNTKPATTAVLTAAVLLALHGIAALIYTFLVSYASERIVNHLRARFFGNLVNERLDTHPPKTLGQIASEFASDLSLVQDGLSGTLIDAIRHALVTVGAFAALFLIDFKMTVLALFGVGIVAGAIVLFIRRVTSSLMTIQQSRAQVMSLLLESASNVYIIQAYGRTAYMSSRFASRLRDMFSRVWRQMLLVASMNPVCLLLFAGVMSVLAMFGMQQLRGAHLTIPNLISYFTFAAVLVASVSQLGYLAGRLRQAGAMLAKHERMLAPAAVPRIEATASVRDAGDGPYGFELCDVTFTYPEKETPAVSEVSFTVPAGKVTAIIGESGSGKSTLAAMLCGIYRPQRGSVQLLASDGASTGLLPNTIDRRIAIVPQEPFLFAGTILENITFGREEITVSRARQAADSARIHDFIMTLPDGYDTQIGEGGRNLSRGQRQRIAIARALAGDPGAVIMDEATASLDVASERAIKAVVDDLRGSVTFVIIAHQGALLSGVDHCIVLHCGTLQSESSVSMLKMAADGVLC